MTRNTNFIKVDGCVYTRWRTALERGQHDSLGETNYIRVQDIIEICEVTANYRLWEESTKEEYDNREPGTVKDWENRSGTYFRRVPTTEITLGFVPQERGGDSHHVEHVGLRVPEHIDSLIARINAIEFPPEPEDPAQAPTQLGYAFAKNNTAILQVTVADIDDYDVIEFSGRAADKTENALKLTEGFSIEVDRADIPINTSPISAPHHVLAIGDAGNINISRSTDGTTLYMIADDAVMAFGISISGVA